MSNTTLFVFLFFIFTVAATYLFHSRDTSELLIGDADIIAQLRKAGSDLSKKHSVDFFMYFSTEEAARRIGEELSARGFSPVVRPASSGSLDWLVQANLKLVPTLESMRQLRMDLSALSATEGGEYDGWGSSLVK